MTRDETGIRMNQQSGPRIPTTVRPLHPTTVVHEPGSEDEGQSPRRSLFGNTGFGNGGFGERGSDSSQQRARESSRSPGRSVFGNAGFRGGGFNSNQQRQRNNSRSPRRNVFGNGGFGGGGFRRGNSNPQRGVGQGGGAGRDFGGGQGFGGGRGGYVHEAFYTRRVDANTDPAILSSLAGYGGGSNNNSFNNAGRGR